MKAFSIGQRVKYVSGGDWKPSGTVIEKTEAVTMNGAVLVAPSYKVRWDDGDESGFLSGYNFDAIEEQPHGGAEL